MDYVNIYNILFEEASNTVSLEARQRAKNFSLSRLEGGISLRKAESNKQKNNG